MKKKLLTSLLVLSLTLSLTACANLPGASGGGDAQNATPQVVLEPKIDNTVEHGKLIMSTNAQFPPYEMTDDNGGFLGIDVEIAQTIAYELGLELVIEDMDFDAALLSVQNGKSDIVMAGVSVTDDRLAVMDFTQSYATGVQVVIVRDGSDVTMENLGEKIIGTQRGTTGYLYASSSPEEGGYGEDHVVAYDTGATAVQALLNGQVDCVIIDNAPAQNYVNNNPGLYILEGDWVNEDYAIGVAKGNGELLDAINGVLDQMRAENVIQEIIDSYI